MEKENSIKCFKCKKVRTFSNPKNWFCDKCNIKHKIRHDMLIKLNPTIPENKLNWAECTNKECNDRPYILKDGLCYACYMNWERSY